MFGFLSDIRWAITDKMEDMWWNIKYTAAGKIFASVLGVIVVAAGTWLIWATFITPNTTSKPAGNLTKECLAASQTIKNLPPTGVPTPEQTEKLKTECPFNYAAAIMQNQLNRNPDRKPAE